MDEWWLMWNYGINKRAEALVFNKRAVALVCAVVSVAALAWGQADTSRMAITLERKEGKVWKAVDPALILASGDVIRFRFKPSFDGYLYVTDYGTSGKYNLLFPRAETGQKNLVESGKEYLIPATEAFFRVSGPAGYESVYWLVSPVALGNNPDFTPAHPSDYKPPVLMPRCDGVVLQARGLCLDPQAGPHAVDATEQVPEDLAKARSVASRELTIIQDHNQSVLSSAGAATAPLLYCFRIAHK
jgi:hypothetical protein